MIGNRKFAVAFAAILLICMQFVSGKSHLVSRSAQELVPAGHWLYDSLMAVSTESGILNFADSAPLSIQELKSYLNEIDYEKLSPAGKAEYDKIQDYFSEKSLAFISDMLLISIEPTLNLSGFYKTNDDIGWVYDRYQRKPFLDAPITIALGDYVALSTDVYFGQNRGASVKNDNYTNIPYKTDYIDVNFPDIGYLSTGYMFTEKTGVNFQFGSGSRSIGKTLTGSILYSEYLTGTAYAQLSLFSPYFKYTGSVAQFNVDKYYYSHQADFRFFKKFAITLYEGLLVYAPLELRFMNPWTVFHGFSAWRDYQPWDNDPESNTCDYFGVKTEATPVKNLRIYGLLALNQFQTPYEKSNWSDSPTPDGIGAQLGTEYYLPVGKGRFHFALEGSWADSYLYIKESPNWSLVRTYSENMGDKEIFYEWIGSPFGPDTISGEFSATYEVPKKYSVNLTYLFMARGEHSGTEVFKNIKWGGSKTNFSVYDYFYYNEYGMLVYGANDDVKNWVYPNKTYHRNWEELRDLVSPSGTPEYVNRISARGTIYPTPWLSITAQPAYVFVFNKSHETGKSANGFEIAVALQWKILGGISKMVKTRE